MSLLLLHLAVKSESQKRTKKVFRQPEKPHVCCTHPPTHATMPPCHPTQLEQLLTDSSSEYVEEEEAAKYSRDAASKCMKIHMARDKYTMGNNRLSRAKKTVTQGGGWRRSGRERRCRHCWNGKLLLQFSCHCDSSRKG